MDVRGKRQDAAPETENTEGRKMQRRRVWLRQRTDEGNVGVGSKKRKIYCRGSEIKSRRVS